MLRVVEQETVGPQHVAVGQREIVADVVAFVGEIFVELGIACGGNLVQRHARRAVVCDVVVHYSETI